MLGLPLMVAIIGGEPRRFAPLVDLYRGAGAPAGHAPEQLQVGLHCSASSADSLQAAGDTIYPGWHEMFTTVSRERGFAPPTRAQFDAMCGPDGAYFIGDPETVATKILRVNDELGGVTRDLAADDQCPAGARQPAARHRAAGHRGGTARGCRRLSQLPASRARTASIVSASAGVLSGR